MPSRPALQFSFRAPIVALPLAAGYHGLAVPDSLGAAWRQAGVKRLLGTVRGVTLRRALQHHSDGAPYIFLGRAVRQELGLSPGEIVPVEFRPDPEPDAVDLTAELELTLAHDPEAHARWVTLTPGRQRTLAHRVASAKPEATRLRRAAEVAGWLRSGAFPWLRRTTKAPRL